MLSTLSPLTPRLTKQVGASVDAITAFTGYDASTLARASRATITARTGGAMFSFDGTDPSPTSGHYIGANQNVAIEGNSQLRNLRFIREGATAADITITLEE